MNRQLSCLIRIVLCSLLLAMVWPTWAFMPCVEGYPGFGTPEEEEQWYNEHVAWALDRIMAYPKTKGFVGPMSKAEATNRAEGCQAIADWWASQSDEWLYNFLPVETPHELCVGYRNGCPIHGGMRGTMQPDLTRKYYYQCQKAKEWWYPGCKVKNPTTGEEITVIDNGEGWVVPEGFQAAGQTYHFVQAWPAGVIKKWVWGAPYGGECTRFDPGGKPAIQSLSYMYAKTGDVKYAHAQGILLNRFAEVYPGYYQPKYGSRWRSSRKMCAANFEPDHMEQIAIAFDLVFDGLLEDEALVKFFATNGDADYNGDGKLTPEDITYNIQKNLMGYMFGSRWKTRCTATGCTWRIAPAIVAPARATSRPERRSRVSAMARCSKSRLTSSATPTSSSISTCAVMLCASATGATAGSRSVPRQRQMGSLPKACCSMVPDSRYCAAARTSRRANTCWSISPSRAVATDTRTSCICSR